MCPCCKKETTYYGNFTYGCSTLGCRMGDTKGHLVLWVVANELQKKLDKAMAGLTQILTKDGQCNRAVDCRAVAERTIKEIENIKG